MNFSPANVTPSKSTFVTSSTILSEGVGHTSKQGELLKQILSFNVDIKDLQPRAIGIYDADLQALANAFRGISETFGLSNEGYRFEHNAQLVSVKDSAGKVLTTFEMSDYARLSERITLICEQPAAKKRLFSHIDSEEELQDLAEQNVIDSEEKLQDLAGQDVIDGIASVNVRSAACNLFGRPNPGEVEGWIESCSKKAKLDRNFF